MRALTVCLVAYLLDLVVRIIDKVQEVHDFCCLEEVHYFQMVANL